MARLNANADDKENSALEKTSKMMENIVITTNPVVITAVQRKVNIGNYETVDVYMGVAIPIELETDEVLLHEAISKAAEKGFKMASYETGIRYKNIKGEGTQ